MISVELFAPNPATSRAQETLAAISKAMSRAGAKVSQTTRTYAGASDWLVFWGPGAPDRAAAMAAQVARGGHAIAFDLAYWNRNRKVRVTIDAPHPQRWVMKTDLPSTRFDRDPVKVDDVWSPKGPAVIAEIGAKAQVQYGQQVAVWEEVVTEELQRLGRRVVRRPKGHMKVIPIERALGGASLLATWHSNAAIDALRLGVPVLCRDGAAAAVCSSFLAPTQRPLDRAVRDRFLRNLAWFQWGLDEMPTCWAFLRELLA